MTERKKLGEQRNFSRQPRPTRKPKDPRLLLLEEIAALGLWLEDVHSGFGHTDTQRFALSNTSLNTYMYYYVVCSMATAFTQLRVNDKTSEDNDERNVLQTALAAMRPCITSRLERMDENRIVFLHYKPYFRVS